METQQYMDVIEGILFIVGDEGIDCLQLSKILEVSKAEAAALMDEFVAIYASRTVKGIQVVCFGGKYKLATNPAHFQYYQKLVEQTSASISNAALETLAIIAYNQPITRTKIEEIRGVGSDSMIRKLVAKALIKEVGREDSLGMPILYGVTNEFMDAFSLTSLDELPDLQDVVQMEQEEDLFKTKYQEEM